MSATQSILRHIRQQANKSATDAALLRQFVERRDNSAFECIILRHGPMVLGVCRRRLDDLHAAEDAFQATFLALSKSAKSIRQSDSLAGWLFRTAQRIAGKARVAAQRRTRNERQSIRPSDRDPAAELTARELLGVLDDELGKLTERDRLPLLLVYWQGRSYAQAARELGLTISAMHGRLERGRARLADRMRSRGFTPGDLGAMLAVATTIAAPGELLAKTAALTVSGAIVPAGVAALGAVTSLGKAQAVMAAALLVGVGVLGITQIGASPSQAEDRSTALLEIPDERRAVAEQQNRPNPKNEKTNAILEGIVVDELGKPVEAAQVRDVGFGAGTQTSTNSEGRFRVVLNRAIVSDGYYLASSSDGLRMAMLPPFADLEFQPVTKVKFVLRPARTISVAVVDKNGAGIAGATVAALDYYPLSHVISEGNGSAQLHVPMRAKIRAIVAAKSGVGFDYCDCPPDQTPAKLVLAGARTARFRALDEQKQPIPGVQLRLLQARKDPSVRAPNIGGCSFPPFDMQSDGNGIVECNWLPAKMNTTALFGLSSEVFSDRQYFQHYPAKGEPTVDVTLRPKMRVAGAVTKPDGSPAAGIVVAAGNIFSRTDSNGRYSLLVPQNEWQMITVRDAEWSSEVFTSSMGRSFGDLDFRLTPGTVVTGRVTVGNPPRPAAGESLTFQLREMSAVLNRTARLDAEGRYSIRLGPAHYSVVGPEMTHSGTLKITDQPSITRDYHFDKLRRFTIEGIVKKPDGSPVANAEIRTVGVNLERPEGTGIASAQAGTDGRFRFVRERVEQLLYACDPLTGQAAYRTLGADDEFAALTLEPAGSLRFRLVDPAGNALARTQVSVHMLAKELDERNPRGWNTLVITDNDGFASVRGLVVGSRCRLGAMAPSHAMAVEIANLKISEAKSYDLGDLAPRDPKRSIATGNP
jgi:RNA polymerase sigma factor (sigma-70 family)